jgi:hypothetical protein
MAARVGSVPTVGWNSNTRLFATGTDEKVRLTTVVTESTFPFAFWVELSNVWAVQSDRKSSNLLRSHLRKEELYVVFRWPIVFS